MEAQLLDLAPRVMLYQVEVVNNKSLGLYCNLFDRTSLPPPSLGKYIWTIPQAIILQGHINSSEYSIYR